jgi:hypothetical protein
MPGISSEQTFDDGSKLVQYDDGTSVALGSSASGTNLKYPLNLFSTTQSVSPAYVKFNILEAIPSEELQGGIKSAGAGLYGTAKALSNLDFSGAADAGKDTLSNLKDHVVKFVGSRLKTKETGVTVALYMPPAIQVNDSMAYDTVDTKGAAEVFSEFAKGGTVEQFVEGGAANLVAQHLLSKYARSGGLFSGVAGNALIAGGRIANPATKLLFRSPSLRQLQLDFKLTPTSQKEALEITKIISVFRQAAYPELDGKAFNALYMIPNLFNIKFAFKNKDGNANPYMIQFKKCYLTQVTTTYNGSGVPAFFKDGSPIETNLTLTFQETETNSSFDIHGTGNSVTVDGKTQQSMY